MGGRVRSAAKSAGASGSTASELHDRLQSRKAEIEQAILTRAYAVSDSSEVVDPTYADGLRAAVGAAIDYGLAGIQSSEGNPPLIPAPLLVQARIAARSGVGLDTVLRRYVAGYALFGDFLIEEAQDTIQGPALKRLLRTQASLFDRLIAAACEEHRREGPKAIKTGERRRLELVKRLLEGEPLDAAELGYDLEGTHVAAVGSGYGLGDALAELASRLGCRYMAVQPETEVVWAWLGRRDQLDPTELKRLAKGLVPTGALLALGESGQALNGWRLTYRQACSALPVGTHSSDPLVCYRDVAVLASIRQDELLSSSLKSLYLDPLRNGRDGGKVAQETLQAYFSAARNASSAAAALGLSRQTVSSRLLAIEELIGQPIDRCATELELAISLESLPRGHP